MADTPLHRLRTPLQRRKDLSQVRRGRMEINSTPDFGRTSTIRFVTLRTQAARRAETATMIDAAKVVHLG